jgi:hypothetical protein
MRVVKSLSLGIIGFNNLISFLCKNNKNETENLFPTQKKDSRIAGNWQVLDW